MEIKYRETNERKRERDKLFMIHRKLKFFFEAEAFSQLEMSLHIISSLPNPKRAFR